MVVMGVKAVMKMLSLKQAWSWQSGDFKTRVDRA